MTELSQCSNQYKGISGEARNKLTRHDFYAEYSTN